MDNDPPQDVIPSGLPPLPEEVCRYLQEGGAGGLRSVEVLSGGMHSRTLRLHTGIGLSYILKLHVKSAPPDGVYYYEAIGLRALAQPDGPRIPAVCSVGENYLLMEDLGRPKAAPTDQDWQRMGSAVAAMHRHTSDRFGLDYGPYRGVSRQSTNRIEDGVEHWLATRLLHFLRWPLVMDTLTPQDVRNLERFAGVFRRSVASDRPALIHGDLWHANAFFTQAGEPALIDPDADYGLREHDVALARQCGGIPDSFFAGYQQAYPLAPGWWERLELYFPCIPLGMIAYVGNRDGHLQALRESIGKYL